MPNGVAASAATTTGSVVMNVLALRAHDPADQGLLWLIVARLALLSLAQSAAT
jgi:hypothetical protein